MHPHLLSIGMIKNGIMVHAEEECSLLMTVTLDTKPIHNEVKETNLCYLKRVVTAPF